MVITLMRFACIYHINAFCLHFLDYVRVILNEGSSEVVYKIVVPVDKGTRMMESSQIYPR